MSKNTERKQRSVGYLSKDKAKVEVKEKVREIRLRQQNWMRQREEQRGQSSGSPSQPGKPSTTGDHSVQPLASSTENGMVPHDVSKDTVTQEMYNNNHVRQEVSASKIHPKGSFKSWMEARESNQFRGDNLTQTQTCQRGVVHNTTLTHPDGGETNVLKLDSERSVECATPDPSWSRDQVLGPASSRSDQTLTSVSDRSLTHPENGLSPDQFDTLADNIISRVRQTLDLNSQQSDTQTHVSSNSAPDQPAQIHPNQMSSHTCPVCRKVMRSPEKPPMLLSPCGHTLCGRCARGRELCPCCHSPVSSRVGNIMLQQIIEDFHGTKAKVKESDDIKHYQPSLYVDSNYIGSNYSQKYSTLKTRHEVLTSERTGICEDLRGISEQARKEGKQLRNIEAAEEKLTSEIEQLQTRLNDLRGHKEEYKVKVTDLDRQKEEKKKKLSVLDEIMRGVESEMEKVLLLSEETGQ